MQHGRHIPSASWFWWGRRGLKVPAQEHEYEGSPCLRGNRCRVHFYSGRHAGLEQNKHDKRKRKHVWSKWKCVPAATDTPGGAKTPLINGGISWPVWIWILTYTGSGKMCSGTTCSGLSEALISMDRVLEFYFFSLRLVWRLWFLTSPKPDKSSFWFRGYVATVTHRWELKQPSGNWSELSCRLAVQALAKPVPPTVNWKFCRMTF